MNGCWLAAQWIFFTLVVSFCIVLAFVGKSPVVLLVPVALFVMFLALGRVWAVLAYPVTTYNRLVGLRNQVDSMVGQVDVYLKRRYDLIPALAEAARGYSNFEADTLARLSELRARAESEVLSADERVDIENRVIGLLEKEGQAGNGAVMYNLAAAIFAQGLHDNHQTTGLNLFSKPLGASQKELL